MLFRSAAAPNYNPSAVVSDGSCLPALRASGTVATFGYMSSCFTFVAADDGTSAGATAWGVEGAPSQPNGTTDATGAYALRYYPSQRGLVQAMPSGADGACTDVLLGSTLKSARQTLTGHERMQAEHFESLVKLQVQDPKQLSQALSLAKYTEHMIEMQHQNEDLDSLRNANYKSMVQQRRQLELSKFHEAKSMMGDWQAEGYQKHHQNIERRRNTEKAALRFEESRPDRKSVV